MKKNIWLLLVVLLQSNVSLLTAQTKQCLRLSIEDMFGMAETNSRSIRTYDLAEKEAEQAVKVSKNALLPSVDVSLSASYLGNGWIANRDFTDGTNASMPHFGNNFALEASQVIYAGGAITNAIEMSKLQLQLAKLDKEKNRQEIRFLLVGNYLELYKLRNQSEVYQKNIEQTKRLLADINAKQNEGLAIRNDITRYELQLKSYELALTQIENSQIIINNQLITVLGLPQGSVIDIDTTILNNMPGMEGEALWQQAASESSPVLKQAKLGIEQSQINEKIINAERLPSVALVAGDHLDGPITIEVPPINKNFNYWYVGVGVKFNIASTFKTGKKAKLAKLSTLKAIEGEKLLQENIQNEVKAAHVRLAESYTIFDTQKKSLELAVQNYEVINNRYLNELALITEMLDASNSKLSAELQVANAQINILFNYYRLKMATGKL